MSIFFKLAASRAASGIAGLRPVPTIIKVGPAIGDRPDQDNPPASGNLRPDQPLRHNVKRSVKAASSRRANMVWSQLAAFAVSTIVTIPAYHYISTMFDSRAVGLMAVSLLLMPLLSVMRCLLDPCAQ